VALPTVCGTGGTFLAPQCLISMRLLLVLSLLAAPLYAEVRPLTDKDVSVELRQADEEEVPALYQAWTQDPCREVPRSHIECRAIAVILHNNTAHYVHIVFMACGDFQMSIELHWPRDSSRKLKPDPKRTVACAANAPQGATIAPGRTLRRVTTIEWIGFGSEPITEPYILARAHWNVLGCIDDQDSLGCGKVMLREANALPETNDHVPGVPIASALVPLYPGSSRYDGSGRQHDTTSVVAVSTKLRESFWFTSQHGWKFSPHDQMLLEFHIRNLGEEPVKVGDAAGWPVCGPFHVSIRDAGGKLIWEVSQEKLRMISAMPTAQALEHGEQSNASMPLDVDNSLSSVRRLPGPGTYTISISPLADPGTTLIQQVTLLAR
jgi:hypothetical protein